jgi:plastocyanin
MALVKIVRSGANLVFDPDPVTLAKSGDFIVWANHDPSSAHQPTMKGQAPNYWMDDPLPKFVAGQPAATSPAINLAGPPSISYVADANSSSPVGTINFA